MLGELDVPYITAQALEFQTIEDWESSDRGLSPVEATMMVAIPELDGATAPIVFGGRSSNALNGATRDIQPHRERIARLADRVERFVRLRAGDRAKRKVAVILFNFPPNAGATGTAAFLGVYEFLHRTLKAMQEAGYTVEVPETVDALRRRIVEGNNARFGAGANVVARINVDDHIRREAHLAEIEAQWGAAPGRHQTDGAALFVLGERFGNVLVGIQPAMGYEGDPMRLLFDRGFAPTHAFSTFYRYLREDFGADVLLHFGMHGSLEFMPGKQVGLSVACWPERLIGAMPNIYLYAANNPSEGALAKRRSAATLVSYLTPSLAHAGLYRGLVDLKAALDRYRTSEPEADHERGLLSELIQSQAAAIDLAQPEPPWGKRARDEIDKLGAAILELEYTLIPHGLHVLGETPGAEERAGTLSAIAESAFGLSDAGAAVRAIIATKSTDAAVAALPAPHMPEARKAIDELARINQLLGEDHENSGADTSPGWSFHCSSHRRRSHSNTGDPADRSQPAWFRSLSHSERLRDRRGRQTVRLRPRPLRRGRSSVSGICCNRLVGDGQSQDRRRADRPGPRPYRRRTALRHLWPPERCEPLTFAKARPPAHRCDADGVGNLPRPPAAASPAASGRLLPRRNGGRAGGKQLSAQTRAGTAGDVGLRYRDGRVARVQQR